MINVLGIQNKIMQHPEYIIEILEALEVPNIKEHDKYISFQNDDGNNTTARVIYKNTLKYINWTRGNNGNIFTLVMQEKKCNFGKALKFVSKTLGIKVEKITLPFNGFYKKLLFDADFEDTEAYIYKESDLPPENSLSKKFLKDGIPLLTQEKWHVRYSHEDDAILIPIKDYVGNLVGCKARNNDPNCDMEHRWWAYLPYRKTQYIFGWYENYRYIQQKNKAIIVESEKSVMILDGWNCHLGLAIGGHTFSKQQIRYIKSLMLDEIIIAFDQGLSEDEVKRECEKLIPRHKMTKTKIGYIYDRKGVILDKERKDAPVDLGKQNFVILRNKYVYWVN